MVGLVSEPAPPHTWRGTSQADAIHDAAGMVYLTHRQVDIILDALQTAGHLTTPATEDPEPGGDDQSVCEYGMR